ncbi:hypothetical protein [Cellulomonas sp. Leaf395]|uniref:hypothetical protein n=1 Tax=Cellulomonas sp. Leaf395 TaxID=1736362 RepID=UPI000A85D4FF|nr:hypothetical protein [Cellulomonas sp. Leaf395]
MSGEELILLAEERNYILWLAPDVDGGLRISGRISHLGSYDPATHDFATHDFAVTVSAKRVSELLAAAGAQPTEAPAAALRRVAPLLLAVGPDRWLRHAGIEHSFEAYGAGDGLDVRWDLPPTDPAAVIVRLNEDGKQEPGVVASAPGESGRQFWVLTGDVWTASSWQEVALLLHDEWRLAEVAAIDPREVALRGWVSTTAHLGLPEPMALPFGPRASYATERAWRDREAAAADRPATPKTETLLEAGAVQVRATLTLEGELTITGRDLSAEVQYEYSVGVEAADVLALASALDVEPGYKLMWALRSRGEEIVGTGERAWLAGLGVPSTLSTRGVPPTLQRLVPEVHEDFLVHWNADGWPVTIGAYGRVTWGPKGAPMFGRYYSWDIHRGGGWSPCAAVEAETCRVDDCISVSSRAGLKGHGLSVAGHVPMPAADASELSRLAEAIATWAHRGRTDTSGLDYIEHPRALANAFDPVTDSEAHCTAWLHAVLEGPSISTNALLEAGIPFSVVSAVQTLTSRTTFPPEAYDSNIQANPIARAVKLADRTHTDPIRPSDGS